MRVWASVGERMLVVVEEDVMEDEGEVGEVKVRF